MAVVIIAAVIGTGASLAPGTVAPAHAASKLETWANAMAKTFSAAGKVFGVEKSVGFLVGTGVLSFAGPLLSMLVSDSGPSLGDVMKKLDGMENQLAAMQDDLKAIDSQVQQVDVDVLMGSCNAETSSLTDLLTLVDSAQGEYDAMVAQMKDIDTLADVENLQKQTDGFVQTVFGSGKTNQTFVDGTDFGSAILAVHNKLITTGGSHGVIETCGKAFLKDWRGGAASSADLPAAGAWLGDEGYYQPLQDLLMYWQTVQAQAVFLLQQASYLHAVEGYVNSVGPLSTEDAAQACASVQKGSDAYALCASTLQFTQKFHDDLVTQWAQAGIPYSSDDVVLSLGSDITGLTAAGGAKIPTTVWVREPDQFGDGLAQGTPQTTAFATDISYDDLSGWMPASSTQWSGLSQGLAASHPATAGQAAGVVQSWSVGSGYDEWKASGVDAFTPVDVLGAMGTVTRSDGTAQFGQTDSLYWIPGETATHDLVYYADRGGLTFPQGTFMPDSPDDVWGAHFLPYYAGTGLSIACMTAPMDGVLCDGQTVGSWWVARQESGYSIESSNYFTKNYTGDATWAVTPSSGSVPAFHAGGRNTGCSGGDYCGIPLNNGVSSMPPWLTPFTDDSGTAHDPAIDAADTYTQRVWPVLAVPTDSGCATVWGVPTRCGDAMSAWITQNITDPSAPTLDAMSLPTVSVGDTADAAVCDAPAWSLQSGPAGQVIHYQDVTWSAADAGGATITVTKPWGAAVSVFDDLAPAMTAAGSTAVTGLSIACTVVASYQNTPEEVEVTSAGVPAALVDGSWQVGVQPPATITDHPDSTAAADGGTVTLSASAAIPDAAAAAASPAGTAPVDPSPLPSPSSPAATPTTSPTPAALPDPRTPMMVLASAATVASDPGTVVRWEKREADSTTWQPVSDAVSVDVSDGISGPYSLGQHAVRTGLQLDDLGGDDHGDVYRAVFLTSDGVQLTSSEAELSFGVDGTPVLWMLLSGAALAVIATVIVIVVRRRGGVRE